MVKMVTGTPTMIAKLRNNFRRRLELALDEVTLERFFIFMSYSQRFAGDTKIALRLRNTRVPDANTVDRQSHTYQHHYG